MKCYNDGVAVVVRIQLRKDGDAVRARNRYRKSWRLKNVMFTLETDPPRPAPTLASALTSERVKYGNGTSGLVDDPYSNRCHRHMASVSIRCIAFIIDIVGI